MTVTKYHEGGFPPDKLDWDKLVPYIGPASAAVARLKKHVLSPYLLKNYQTWGYGRNIFTLRRLTA